MRPVWARAGRLVSNVQWPAFLPSAMFAAASPEAGNLLAFADGSRAGWFPAAIALICRSGAFALMIGLVMAGLDVLLATSAAAFCGPQMAGRRLSRAAPVA